MVRQFIENTVQSPNPFRRALFGSVVGSMIALSVPFALALVYIGENKQKVEQMDKLLDAHLDAFTVVQTAEIQQAKVQVALNVQQIKVLEATLADIKAQNNTIIQMIKRQ